MAVTAALAARRRKLNIGVVRCNRCAACRQGQLLAIGANELGAHHAQAIEGPDQFEAIPMQRVAGVIDVIAMTPIHFIGCSLLRTAAHLKPNQNVATA